MMLSVEQGKPLAESKREVRYATSFIGWYAEEAKCDYDEMLPSYKMDARILVSRQPVGVITTITPWSFPAATSSRKCAIGFSAGCLLLLKSAQDTPFTALALADLAKQVVVPDVVLQVVTGNTHSH
ncbi:aldehyde dehydrogenase family protein [Vibrio mimicus]